VKLTTSTKVGTVSLEGNPKEMAELLREMGAHVDSSRLIEDEYERAMKAAKIIAERKVAETKSATYTLESAIALVDSLPDEQWNEFLTSNPNATIRDFSDKFLGGMAVHSRGSTAKLYGMIYIRIRWRRGKTYRQTQRTLQRPLVGAQA
jgi:hypothetical protein